MSDQKTDNSPKPNKTKRRETCAICSKEIQRDSEFFPFCSRRCKLVDLNKWFKGDYQISRPADQVNDD